MEVTWHSSACVSFTSSSTKVLFDPWLKDPAFLGSWRQWPPADLALESVQNTKFEFIVYSHFHSDHWDSAFLKAYLTFWKKMGHKPKILFTENSWPQLYNSARNLVKSDADVILLTPGTQFDLNARGFKLTAYESDYCDPKVCGKQIPCFSSNPKFRSIDSAVLIEDRDVSILNLNDAVGSNIDLHLQAKNLKVDMIMGVFGAAGSFPQCIDNMTSAQKEIQGQAFIDGALNRLVKAANRLSAKYIFPFAGQYILGGKLSSLNSERAVEPVNVAADKLSKKTQASIFTLDTNESACFKNHNLEKLGKSYLEPSSKIKQQYLNKFQNDYPYETRSIDKINLKQLSENLLSASKKLTKLYSMGGKTEYSIKLISSNLDFNWTLNFGEELIFGEIPVSFEKNCFISLDARLLDGCVRRKSNYSGFTSMHWNQAHIGSHLRFNQNTYDTIAHYLLNFLHT
jgi:UDP-MurNAc hydroxylase